MVLAPVRRRRNPSALIIRSKGGFAHRLNVYMVRRYLLNAIVKAFG